MSHAVRDEWKRKLRPELELVIYSIRPSTPENDTRIRALLHENLNWNEVLAYAHQHKLSACLQERFRALDGSLIAPDQRKRLDELERDVGKNNLANMGEMIWLCGLFEDAKIPNFPFKGPALAWLAYKNFAHRSCVDLDFVLPQSRLPEAAALLQAHGYTPQFSPAEARVGERGPAPGQYAFAPSGRRRYVELHTERTLRYFPRPIDLDELGSRAIHLKIGGQNIRVFSAEDLLVMLCVHGAKHFWERLSWIVDVAQLIAAREVDWELLLGIAERMESTRVLLLGLYLAHEVAAASLPQFVLERAGGDRQVRWLAGQVFDQYGGISNPSAGIFHRAMFRLQSCDGVWQGLRQLVRLSLSPTEIDREAIRLPGYLAPLYALVRPFRLVGKYGLGLIRRPEPDLAIDNPRSQEVVEQILRFANIGPEDVLYDLGCGDGSLVVAAAEEYGIRAVAVDINPTRIAEAQRNALQHRVGDRVDFLLSDAGNVDVSGATILMLDLEASAVLRLAGPLRAQLRPGARIVSRSAPICAWEPDRSETFRQADGNQTVLCHWTIPKAENKTHRDECASSELPQTRNAGR